MQDGLKWFEIFRSGKRTSSNGVTRDYSLSDLDQAVETYNPDNFKAPLIVSYPAHHTGSYSDRDLHKSQIAFGYPEKLKRVGDRLMGGFKKISPKIGEWIRDGGILGFSASFYLPNSLFNPYPGNLALRHVAACGVDPPAVKGMSLPDDFTELNELDPIRVSFERIYSLEEFADYAEDQDDTVEFGLEAEADDETIENARIGVRVWQALKMVAERCRSNVASFSPDSSFMAMGDGSTPIASLFKDFYQRSRDRFIEEKGVEEADKIYPTYVLDQLAVVTSQPSPSFATWEDVSRLQSQIDRLSFQLRSGEGEEGGSEDNLGEFLNDYSEEEEESMGVDEAEFEEMKERQGDLETKVRLLTLENQRLTQERENDRVTAFCEQLVRDRKLLPTQKDREVRFILSLDNNNTADYGEEGELTPRVAYMNKLSGGRELWSNKQMPIGPEDAPAFTEKAPNGFDARSTAQNRQIQAYAKEHNLEFTEALDALIESGALR
jgi:hypothetical protein